MFSPKLSPLVVNGWSLVTSVMSSVLGHSGSCRCRGRPVDMPLISCLVFSFSRLLIQWKQVMAPLYHESYWIPCNVNNAFKRSYFRMPMSRFGLHHMPIMLLFLPLQRCEKLEGGPPCNSMPLVWLGLTICIIKSSYFLVRHRKYKITLLFCLGGSCPSLKVCEVKCVPGDPATTCSVLFKWSRSLLSLA